MELYQLRYFLEVARLRNFTRAAGRLHLAQAALSEQIRKLEAEFGTALFVRGRRESTLTAAGETLVPRAELLLAQAEDAQRAVTAVAGLRAGRLIVACIPTVSACLLPPVIAAFRQRYPGVELMLAEDTSENVAEWVRTGRAEIGFVQLPAVGRDFEVQVLLTEGFVLLLPARHRATRTSSVRLADFAAEPFIFYKGRARESALDACRRAGFEPRIACETGGVETICALVAAGLGVAVVPALAARQPGRSVVARPIREPKVQRQLGLLRRRGYAASAAAEAFVSVLRESA